MRNIIIGTAGHVDHGKTSLIKILANVDTDSLEEEKKRGISINLGFTFFDLPSKRRAGIIDVPGHEKFIKNMLAGATGIDVVLLVISCEEGIKPQTKEHLDILSMLDLKKGIVVLTKRDLVDDEWYELIESEVKDKLSNTFLKDAKVIPFSSKTKEGYKELLEEIDNILNEDFGKSTEGIFRMPIDRCFSVSGFGTVVTGTIISGTINVNDNVCIYPDEIECKVRNIQVYEQNCDKAYAGQRCALNLANVKKENIERGFVVSKKNCLNSSYMVDCKFYALSDLDKNILNRQRIRFFHGASEIIGRIHILDKEEIKKGEEVYVQFHLEKPLISMKNDRYVVRLYSPMITVGGGYIINPSGSRFKLNNRQAYLESLIVREKEFGTEYIFHLLDNDEEVCLSLKNICEKYMISENEVEKVLEELINNKDVIEFVDSNKKYFITSNNLNKVINTFTDILKNYHDKNKFKVGYLKEELKTKLKIKNLRGTLYDKFLKYLESSEIIKVTSKYVYLHNFKVNLDEKSKNICDLIINEYKNSKFIPPKLTDLERKINCKDFNQLHEYLEEMGLLYKVNQEMYLTKEDFLYAKNKIIEFLEVNKEIELKDAKNLLNSNRKYLVFLLEHFDEIKLTMRNGDKRVLFKT